MCRLMPGLGLRSIALAISVFPPVTSYLAGVRWSVGCSSSVSLFVISIFAMISLCAGLLTKSRCIVSRTGVFLQRQNRGELPSNHRVLELHYFEYLLLKRKRTVATFWRCNSRTWKAITFLLPPQFPTHTHTKWQTKIQTQRVGLMSFDRFLYMIPFSFQVSDWLGVYTGWIFISWLWVCMSNNQLWHFKE